VSLWPFSLFFTAHLLKSPDNITPNKQDVMDRLVEKNRKLRIWHNVLQEKVRGLLLLCKFLALLRNLRGDERGVPHGGSSTLQRPPPLNLFLQSFKPIIVCIIYIPLIYLSGLRPDQHRLSDPKRPLGRRHQGDARRVPHRGTRGVRGARPGRVAAALGPPAVQGAVLAIPEGARGEISATFYSCLIHVTKYVGKKRGFSSGVQAVCSELCPFFLDLFLTVRHWERAISLSLLQVLSRASLSATSAPSSSIPFSS
jgi:hypothetical protein